MKDPKPEIKGPELKIKDQDPKLRTRSLHLWSRRLN